MLKLTLCFSPLLLVGFLMQDATPAPPPIPPEAKALVSPITPTPASLDRARKIYAYDCALCHGAAGKGDGAMAADLKFTMKDYTDPNTLKDSTDGELFYIITNGRGNMPPEGDRQKPEVIWNLVALTRTFARK